MDDGSVPKPGSPKDRGTVRSGQAFPRVLVSNRQDVPVDLDGLSGLAADTLAAEGRDDVELSLSLVTPEEMEDLHVRYMQETGPTDVLAFPMEDDDLIGDVVVCPAVAKRNNPDVQSELRLLVVHGALHLLGYDHQEEDDRREMWARQERYTGVTAP
jgi:probable rRNA maturation factor